MYLATKSGSVIEIDAVKIDGGKIRVMVKATGRPRTFRVNSVKIFDSPQQAVEWIMK